MTKPFKHGPLPPVPAAAKRAQEKIRQHEARLHQRQMAEFRCPHCTAEFVEWRRMEEHVLQKHPEKEFAS